MIVVEQDGWEQSKGVEKEIHYCIENDIPYTHASAHTVDIIDAYKALIGGMKR